VQDAFVFLVVCLSVVHPAELCFVPHFVSHPPCHVVYVDRALLQWVDEGVANVFKDVVNVLYVSFNFFVLDHDLRSPLDLVFIQLLLNFVENVIRHNFILVLVVLLSKRVFETLVDFVMSFVVSTA